MKIQKKIENLRKFAECGRKNEDSRARFWTRFCPWCGDGLAELLHVPRPNLEAVVRGELLEAMEELVHRHRGVVVFLLFQLLTHLSHERSSCCYIIT